MTSHTVRSDVIHFAGSRQNKSKAASGLLIFYNTRKITNSYKSSDRLNYIWLVVIVVILYDTAVPPMRETIVEVLAETECL